jgi:Mg2+ and Co2+ transporter CorA
MSRGLNVHQIKTHRQQTISVHVTLPEHTSVQQTPYTCHLIVSQSRATYQESSYSHTRLYKSDLASPQGMIHFSHTFYALFMSSNTNLSVGVLTCLHTPFVPPWRLIATVPEHFLPPLPTSVPHQTDHLTLEGGDQGQV